MLGLLGGYDVRRGGSKKGKRKKENASEIGLMDGRIACCRRGWVLCRLRFDFDRCLDDKAYCPGSDRSNRQECTGERGGAAAMVTVADRGSRTKRKDGYKRE